MCPPAASWSFISSTGNGTPTECTFVAGCQGSFAKIQYYSGSLVQVSEREPLFDRKVATTRRAAMSF